MDGALKILLVNPPACFPVGAQAYCCPPLGLASLAAVLDSAFEVKILDCLGEGFVKVQPVGTRMMRYGLANDEIEIRLTRDCPDIVAISSVSSDQWDNVSAILSSVKNVSKQQMKDICTVVGGVHPTFHASEIMKDPRVDFVIIGEGEGPFYEFCECWKSGLGVSRIEGLVYRDFMDSILVNPRVSYIESYDYIPLPARDRLIMEKYIYQTPYSGPTARIPHGTVHVSRGCSEHCANCAVPGIHGGVTRFHSVEKVIEEIQALIDAYGLREIQFEGANLLQNRQWAVELFSKIAEKSWDLTWVASSGLCLWNLDDEMIALMKKSGCVAVWLAIETGSPRVLRDVVRKPGNLERLRDAVKIFRKQGISARGIFSLGFPGETKEEMNETVNYALSLGLGDLRFQIATPYPGMPMWDECQKHGYIEKNISFKELMLPEGFVQTPEFSREDTLKFYEWGMSRAGFKKLMSHPSEITERLPALIASGIHRPAETVVSIGRSLNYLLKRGMK